MNLLRRATGRGDRRVLPGWDGLNRRWRDAEFVVVDLEATGLDLKRDDIVSYGAVVVREGRIIGASARYGLVKPRREISDAAATVHALTVEELAHAPPLEDCADAMVELLAGRALVAHAAWVERAFLTRALRSRGVKLSGPVIDTAALARELHLAPGGDDRTEPSLERLAMSLHLPVHTPHHALGDAMTTAGLFLALVTRLDAREPQTVSSLAEISRRHGRA